MTAQRTTKQQILDAIVDLHNAEQMVTREALPASGQTGGRASDGPVGRRCLGLGSLAGELDGSPEAFGQFAVAQLDGFVDGGLIEGDGLAEYSSAVASAGLAAGVWAGAAAFVVVGVHCTSNTLVDPSEPAVTGLELISRPAPPTKLMGWPGFRHATSGFCHQGRV